MAKSPSGAGPLLTSAPPPGPTVATLIAIAAISISLLPAWDEVKEKATLETLGSSPYLDNQVLGWLRVACVAICLSAPLSWLLYPKEVETNFLPGSKLVDGVVAIAGYRNMIFFTNWAFTLLIFSFAGMAAASFALDSDYITVSPTMRALTLLSWELAAPNGFLTSTVITYVIWPTFLKEKKDTLGLQTPAVLLTHCGNTMIILLEMALGKTPILWNHAGAAPILGIVYCLFSWAVAPYVAPKYGAQYLYFFLDTTRGWVFSTVSILALLACLLAFYFLSVLPSHEYIDEALPLWAIMSSAAVIAYLLCKFRD